MGRLKSLDEVVVELHNSANSSSNDISEKRKSLRSLLQNLYGEKNKDLSLSETIEVISKLADKDIMRDAAMILLRVTSLRGVLPENTPQNRIDLRLSLLFDKSIPDFYSRFNIDKKDQTYGKIKQLESVHDQLCKRIDSLNEVGSTLRSIIGARQKIQKVLTDSVLNSYFLQYEFKHISNEINNIFIQLALYEQSAELFFEEIPCLLELINKEKKYCDDNSTFVTRDYYVPFLSKVESALLEEQARSLDKFQCEILSPTKGTIHFEKKFPLSGHSKLIRVALPLINTGPGSARDVRGSISVNSKLIALEEDEVRLGNVRQGNFIIPFSFMAFDCEESVTVDVLVDWKQLGKLHASSKVFQCVIEAQDSDIDWESIEYVQPYSIEIARGEEFVGRQDLVRKILGKLLGSSMQSSYITGQKRVGKSSLAQAVIDKSAEDGVNLHFIYKECGDYSHSRGEDTVNSLGAQLSDELSQFLPSDITFKEPEFIGSLAPLAILLGQLNKHVSNKKFVIVLDEFDEINHDLYRYGPLAETFFLNLRTISGKRNVAFILVGGEKMPYVMSSQGDKLNKFSGISLDTFNQETEWKDYEDLIRAHSPQGIQWHDSAVRSIYEETDGHPYFTKLLCANLLEKSILDRDAEITREEVDSCMPSIIDQLEGNVFAHFWKDGIQGSHEDAEVKQLKRCHLLIGYARAVRSSVPLNVENITAKVSKTHLNSSEVQIFLRDFCVRRIMNEENSEYRIRVGLFKRWLVDKGLNVLITDQLGDELLEEQMIKEDAAYVRPVEIQELIQYWPTYQGRQITAEDIRAWLDQEATHVNQRLLFKLLLNLRFPKDEETREKFKEIHDKIKKDFPLIIQKKKSDRRKDILVTHVDGQGKSGSHHSALYCHESGISTTRNIEIGKVSQTIESSHRQGSDIGGMIIVDDFIGTGKSLATNLKAFIADNSEILAEYDIPIRVVVLFSTVYGEEFVRAQMLKLVVKDIDLVVCETLDVRHMAFGDGLGFWDSLDEKERAKALCVKYGSKIARKSPLGFQDEGLLITFTRNCPNNTLLILHSEKAGIDGWRPLFKRTFT